MCTHIVHPPACFGVVHDKFVTWHSIFTALLMTQVLIIFVVGCGMVWHIIFVLEHFPTFRMRAWVATRNMAGVDLHSSHLLLLGLWLWFKFNWCRMAWHFLGRHLDNQPLLVAGGAGGAGCAAFLVITDTGTHLGPSLTFLSLNCLLVSGAGVGLAPECVSDTTEPAGTGDAVCDDALDDTHDDALMLWAGDGTGIGCLDPLGNNTASMFLAQHQVASSPLSLTSCYPWGDAPHTLWEVRRPLTTCQGMPPVSPGAFLQLPVRWQAQPLVILVKLAVTKDTSASVTACLLSSSVSSSDACEGGMKSLMEGWASFLQCSAHVINCYLNDRPLLMLELGVGHEN